MTDHIVISHSMKDDPDVAALRTALEGLGVYAWTDSRELIGGHALEPEIERAIEEARHFVVLLSPRAVSSPWVRKEITHALKVRKSRGDGYRVIPILIDPIDHAVLPLYFGDEPVALKYRSAPGAVAELLPDLLAALGLRAPEDPEGPTAEPAPEVSELTLELRDPEIDAARAGGGPRRARATAELVYEPPPGSGERRVTSPRFVFTAPLGEIEAGELAWYLERYHQWPAGPFRERALQVEAALAEWGRRLAQPLLSGTAREAFEAWRRAPEEAARRLSILVDPEPVGGSGAEKDVGEEAAGGMKEAATLLLGLPWELVHDGTSHLFEGARPVRVRRRLPHRRAVAPLVTATPVRVLLVSPRPEDERATYIDHRVSARPLVEALEPLGELAEVKLLEPPTFKALEEELIRARKAGEPYHVVHFDGHGLYDRRHGLGGLCFEDPVDQARLEKRRSQIVQADELARVMRDHRVPLVFLEACQSARSEADPTASVASRLLDGGVASVVAMSHTVLVETARRFVEVFYRELVAGRRIGDAMLAGQRALARDTLRGRRFTGELHLQDWFVPVLFQEELDPQLIARVPAQRVREVGEMRRKEALGELPAEPGHSFLGRSRELLALERLFARERYAVLLGEAGEGKTTLAAELARWLVVTRRFERAVFISLERLPAARQILYALGEQLVTGFGSRAGGDDERARQLVDRALRDRRTIIVVDNMESVLPPPMELREETVVTTYEPKALEALFDLCRRILGAGETRVVFTSREAVPEPFAGHRVWIGRLPRREAIELVARVLEHEGKAPPAADPGRSEEEIGELVDAVECHARSLVLVAREVSEGGVRHATKRLHEIMAKIAERHPDDRELSLFASVELSLRRLPASTRERLPRLAVFRGGGHWTVIAVVLGLEASPDEAMEITRQLVAVGLAEPMAYGYFRLHPALAPALDRELDDVEREDVQELWLGGMVGLAQFLAGLQVKDPEVATNLTLFDLPNLLAALEQLPQSVEPERVVECAAVLETLLRRLDRPQALGRVVRVLEAATDELGDWSHARFTRSRAAVEGFLCAGQLSEAVVAAERLVAESVAGGDHAYPQASYDLASAYWYLGRSLRSAGAVEASLEPLGEARGRFQQLAAGGDAAAARMVTSSIGELGYSLITLGRLDEAAQAYEESIRRSDELDDPRASAVARGQLATISFRLGRYQEALDAHHKAREVFERFGEPANVAGAWRNIGMILHEIGDYDVAEEAYRHSLKSEVERGNRSGEAATLGQLGLLLEVTGRLEEAESLHRQAVEIYRDLGDLLREGRQRLNAAIPLIKLERYAEARRDLARAVQCKAPYGPAAEPWLTFEAIRVLERAVGSEEAAVVARERAVDAYLSYRRDGGENNSPAGQFFSRVHATLVEGALGEVENLALELAEVGQSAELAPPVQAWLSAVQALLAGSRDPALAADPELRYESAAEILLLLERLR